MPTIEFSRPKFLYDHDDGSQSIKYQRVYIDSTTNSPLTAITPLFQDRIIVDPNVIATESASLRYGDVCVYNPSNSQGFTITKSFIPYRPGDILLKEHLQEILSLNWVNSVTYVGEKTTII